MKKLSVIAVSFGVAFGAMAQNLNISNQDITYSFPASAEVMTYSNGNTVAVGGRSFSLAEFPVMTVTQDIPVSENTVSVIYSGERASVTVHGNIAQYVDVTVNGANVNVVQSDLVSENTCGEITYILKGESGNGSFTLTGSYKSSLELQGVSLVNPSGAAIDIQNGKRISVSAKNGTVNSLTDGDGSQKAALYCKGHLELKGKGELNVNGTKAHAVSAKEYIEIKNLTLNITGAVKDGINCNQYFSMASGTVSISGTGDDGIQVSYKDETDREPEDTGTFSMSGGTLSINVAKGEASKGIKADGDVNILNGDITVESECDGMWDEAKLKTKASSCIGADGNIYVADGKIRLTAKGSGGKGISCDGVFTADGGDFTIVTTGGLLAYSGGKLNHNYTGSSDNLKSDYKSSSKGIKADNGLVINGGTFYVTTATNNAEGMESKNTLDISGGEIFIKAYDDGINSSGDLTISGGDITVISVVGDGIDSNANMFIKGGTVVSLGSGGAEMGLDAADENKCYVYVSGGNILSFGGRNPTIKKGDVAQAVIYTSTSIAAKNVVAAKSGDDTLVSFTIPSEYTSSTSGGGPRTLNINNPDAGGWSPGGSSGSGKLLLSCPQLVSGTSYTITNGSSTSNATATYTVSSGF